jgi:uncharacterized protein (DUF433 family)
MREIIKTVRQWPDEHHQHREGNVMAKDYVEQHDEAYWIAGTRVSLDSVVYAFLEGLAPESIVDSFDTLTLEEVYGALAFYLGHRDEIDAYLRRSEAQFDELCRRARAANPLLYRKLDEARQRIIVRS